MANPDKVTFCLGSDGSFQEGNDAEAARLAVAKQLNIKILFDDNDVTVSLTIKIVLTSIEFEYRLPVILPNVSRGTFIPLYDGTKLFEQHRS